MGAVKGRASFLLQWYWKHVFQVSFILFYKKFVIFIFELNQVLGNYFVQPHVPHVMSL